MTIEEKLKEIETNLGLYQQFVNDPSCTIEEKRVVSFKVLYDMMAFSALREFAPDYRASENTEFTMASGLKNVTNLVGVRDGKVIISPEYRQLLLQKEEFLKNQNKN